MNTGLKKTTNKHNLKGYKHFKEEIIRNKQTSLKYQLKIL